MRGNAVSAASWLAGGFASAALLAGCAGWSLGTEKPAPVGLNCVDDSPRCVQERLGVLKGLMDDKQRTWVRQPTSPEAYASGVRLFALKARKRELTCDELAMGRREAEAAAKTLRGASGAGLTPAQVSRGVMLGGEVARELANESNRRCRT